LSISHTNPAGSAPFIELPVVDSTNNYAMHLLQQGAVEHGTSYFAHRQTAGKGTRGKKHGTARRNKTLSYQ